MACAVTAALPPSPSLVEHALDPCHYVDAFCLQTSADTFGEVDALARASARLPRWVDALLALRDRIVRVFGLKTEPDEPPLASTDAPIQPGNAVGIFLVLARSADEILMGLDDKHLDFRFSLLLQPRDGGERATATTTVRFHNLGGRLYFFFVKPFHKLIVPAMLRAAVRTQTASRQPAVRTRGA